MFLQKFFFLCVVCIRCSELVVFCCTRLCLYYAVCCFPVLFWQKWTKYLHFELTYHAPTLIPNYYHVTMVVIKVVLSQNINR